MQCRAASLRKESIDAESASYPEILVRIVLIDSSRVRRLIVGLGGSMLQGPAQKHQLSTAEPPSPQDYRHRGPGSSHSPPPRHHKYQLDISRCLGVPRCGSVAEGTGQAFDFTVPTFRCAGDATACSLRPKSNSCSSEGPLKKQWYVF